jgi:hypothetical protein
VDFIRIEQGHLAFRHISCAVLDLSGPKGVGIRVAVFGVQAGDELMGQSRPVFGG